MKVALGALLASAMGLVAAQSSRAQGLDFGPWTFKAKASNGNAECYMSTQLANSSQDIKVGVLAADDGKLDMFLRESNWDTQPDDVSTIVTVTFYIDKSEEYSKKFRASKKGKAIAFGFGPTESGYVSDWLRTSTTMTIDLVRTKDATSIVPSEPMLSEIKLPWIVRMSEAPEALAQLQKCSTDSASKTPSHLPPMNEDDKQSFLEVLYTTYSIAERCADSNASFNKQQVAAMKSAVKSRVDEMNISREDNDKTWALVQSQVAATSLTEKDCDDARHQSSYMFPPEVFMSGGKANPF